MAADQPFTLPAGDRRDAERPACTRTSAAPPLRRLVRRLVPAVAADARHRGDCVDRQRLARAVAAPGRSRPSASASSPAHSCTRGASTRSRRSSSAPTSRTSSPRTSRRSSPTASSAASRSSRATPSALRTPRPRSSGAFVAHARGARLADRDPRCVRAMAARPTPRTGCTRSTTATRRSSTPRRSRSRAGRSERCASRCTGWRHAGYVARALRPSEIDGSAARRARERRGRLARRPARARLRDGARRALLARRRARRVRRRVRTPTARRPASCTSRSRLRVPVALALVDAAAAHDAERLQRVADLRGGRAGRAERATSTSR